MSASKFESNFTKKYYHHLLAASFFVIIFFAYSNRFIQDDAFISFRYAKNLVEGYGFVWNPHERVQGYTNFLWTIIMTIPHLLNIDVTIFSQALGLTLFVFTLFIFHQLCKSVFETKIETLLALLLLGSNYSFSAYATGGLETQLQTFHFVLIIYLTLKIHQSDTPQKFWLILLSFLYATALLSRLDSALLVFTSFFFLIYSRVKTSKTSNISFMAILSTPVTIIMIGWLIWTYNYYGDIFPNTFYSKLGSRMPLWRGFVYLFHFLDSYLLFPLFLYSLIQLRNIRWSLLSDSSKIFLFIILIFNIYFIKTGGDFMEFRFLVPIFPFIFICIVKLISRSNNQNLIFAFAFSMVIGSLCHRVMYKTINGISSINNEPGLVSRFEKFKMVGKELKKLFPNKYSSVLLGTTAAGVMPYESELLSLDLHGLTDEWIAKNGVIKGTKPGHQRNPTFEYLIEKKVNLIYSGTGYVYNRYQNPKKTSFEFADLKPFKLEKIDPQLLPSTACVLELLIDNYQVKLVYLTQNDEIDRVIKKFNLRTYPIIRPAT